MPPRTIPNRRRLTHEEIEVGEELADYQGESRPRNRTECIDGPRPCPYVSCRYHLYLCVKPNLKCPTISISFPDIGDPTELEWTCALDEADRGGMTLGEIGDRLNITRERARQLEEIAFRKLRRTAGQRLDIQLLLGLFEHLQGRGAESLWDYF